MERWLRTAHLIVLLSLPLIAGADTRRTDDGRWIAGGYSYSDELGGFRILSAEGTGTLADPVVLIEEMQSASPTTLVVRAARTIQPYAQGGAYANGFISIEIRTVNASGFGWVGFEWELQEIRGMPSRYGDGLSFDQRRTESQLISSDSFARYERQFEPGDRVLFEGGGVDPGATARFRFFITDFTPVPVFYIVQDPRIPFS